jgi:hypothetical protein
VLSASSSSPPVRSSGGGSGFVDGLANDGELNLQLLTTAIVMTPGLQLLLYSLPLNVYSFVSDQKVFDRPIGNGDRDVRLFKFVSFVRWCFLADTLLDRGVQALIPVCARGQCEIRKSLWLVCKLSRSGPCADKHLPLQGVMDASRRLLVIGVILVPVYQLEKREPDARVGLLTLTLGGGTVATTG